MGLDLDPENEKLREALQGVSDDLTGAQLKLVRCADVAEAGREPVFLTYC